MIGRYNLIQEDHPGNTKDGYVCIYYRELLTVCSRSITSLTKCLFCEVNFQNKMGYVDVVHCSPS